RIEVRRRGRRSLRLAEKQHLRFGEGAATLLVVAVAARGDHVLPGVLSATMTRHHVIEREVVATLAAVLAGVVVALKDLFTRQLHDRARPLHVIDETDHGR